MAIKQYLQEEISDVDGLNETILKLDSVSGNDGYHEVPKSNKTSKKVYTSFKSRSLDKECHLTKRVLHKILKV